MYHLLFPLILSISASSPFSPTDLFSDSMIGARSGDILQSFSSCEVQQGEVPSGSLLCQTQCFGKRIGVSFVFDEERSCKMIAGVVEIVNDMNISLSFLRPALGTMAASFPIQQDKRTPTGKEWFFVSKSGAIAMVELKKTNVGQWAVTFMVIRKPDETNGR